MIVVMKMKAMLLWQPSFKISILKRYYARAEMHEISAVRVAITQLVFIAVVIVLYVLKDY